MGFGVRGDAEYLRTAREAKIRCKLKNERKGSNDDLRGKRSGLGVRRPGFQLSSCKLHDFRV